MDESLIVVPMLYGSHVIGTVALAKLGVDQFDDEDVRLLEVLAAHAAVAIENARLFDAAQHVAVLDERHRLARELHDAVAQQLFSASLVAQAIGPAYVRYQPSEFLREFDAHGEQMGAEGQDGGGG